MNSVYMDNVFAVIANAAAQLPLHENVRRLKEEILVVVKREVIAEREACAKVCEEHQVGKVATQYDWTRQVGQDLADSIRMRSNG